MKRLFGVRRSVVVLVLIAMILSLVFVVAPALAAERDAKVTFVHAVNGVKIHQTRELPVDIQIFKAGKLHHTLMSFKYHQRFSLELPAGSYKFMVLNHATGKTLASKTAVIKGGATVRLRFMLDVKEVPFLQLKHEGKK